jgi:hypothetical protein
MINTGVVKNLVASFCKVDEEGLEKWLPKKNKVDAHKKAPGPAHATVVAPLHKGARVKAQTTSSVDTKEKKLRCCC